MTMRMTRSFVVKRKRKVVTCYQFVRQIPGQSVGRSGYVREGSECTYRRTHGSGIESKSTVVASKRARALIAAHSLWATSLTRKQARLLAIILQVTCRQNDNRPISHICSFRHVGSGKYIAPVDTLERYMQIGSVSGAIKDNWLKSNPIAEFNKLASLICLKLYVYPKWCDLVLYRMFLPVQKTSRAFIKHFLWKHITNLSKSIAWMIIWLRIKLPFAMMLMRTLLWCTQVVSQQGLKCSDLTYLCYSTNYKKLPLIKLCTTKSYQNGIA